MTCSTLLFLSLGCGNEVEFDKQSLSPQNWSEEQWEKARLSDADSLGSIVGDSIMLINTGSSEAAYAGLQVLKKRGPLVGI